MKIRADEKASVAPKAHGWQRMVEPEVRYYTDETRDDFAGVTRRPYEVPPDFDFTPAGWWWRAAAFAVYRLIMTPVAFCYCRLRLHLKIVDKRTVRPKRGKGFFLFANHTLLLGDAFWPSCALFPRRVYVLVGPENLATPGTRHFLQMSGALPIPASPTGCKALVRAIHTRIAEGHAVTVYPEAHVWPYYTGIRPYPSRSFRFAVQTDAPVYAATVTFQKRRLGKRPQVTVYLDGPFVAAAALSPRKAEQQLRNTVYGVMCERARNSTCELVQYRKKETS